ncbi:MAG: mannosyl-3-phosphoglycerate synthase [Hyperthermus sp.]|nr:MAG: mannosyl-3-phosphoglycerate synthase [Hyperthermus sp.]
MLIERATRFELYGAVRLFEPVRVIELDATGADGANAFLFPHSRLEEMASRLTIVIPVKDDELLSLEGVISGVPHAMPIVIVSASSREPVDRYKHEYELARMVHERTGRSIVVMHQRDPAWAETLYGTALESLVDEKAKSVRYGKGEGMLLGFMAALWSGARYVGFIDSDNYVPGSVYEYSVAYLAGFSLATSDKVMVRIKWPYKGKMPGVSSDVYLRKRGRVSVYTNRVINLALSVAKGVETDIVQTANSGEHAMTVELGREMEWAGGFAIEPYQLVSLLSKCWLELKNDCPGGSAGIDVIQIETRNPHLHAERGDEHLVGMLAASLGTIYHSSLCSPRVREEIMHMLREQGYREEPPAPRVYPPLSTINVDRVFEEFISLSKDTLILPER